MPLITRLHPPTSNSTLLKPHPHLLNQHSNHQPDPDSPSESSHPPGSPQAQIAQILKSVENNLDPAIIDVATYHGGLGFSLNLNWRDRYQTPIEIMSYPVHHNRELKINLHDDGECARLLGLRNGWDGFDLETLHRRLTRPGRVNLGLLGVRNDLGWVADRGRLLLPNVAVDGLGKMVIAFAKELRRVYQVLDRNYQPRSVNVARF